MAPLAVTSVCETFSGLSRRSRREDVRGVCDESCPVQTHKFELFYSRFHSRLQVHLNRTPSHSFRQIYL
jgi:hypothetical protein